MPFFRKLRNTRNFIHVNLMLSLFIRGLTFFLQDASLSRIYSPLESGETVVSTDYCDGSVKMIVSTVQVCSEKVDLDLSCHNCSRILGYNHIILLVAYWGHTTVHSVGCDGHVSQKIFLHLHDFWLGAQLGFGDYLGSLQETLWESRLLGYIPQWVYKMDYSRSNYDFNPGEFCDSR